MSASASASASAAGRDDPHTSASSPPHGSSDGDDALLYLSPPGSPLARSLTLSIVSLAGKFTLNVLNTTTFDNLPTLLDAVDATSTPASPGLITVSNHASTLDDPFLFCAMLPLSFFSTEHLHNKTRWSICAREMCYKNYLLGQFFRSGKTLPIERGKGLYQPVMGVVARAVARGEWVHVFPEGRIHFNNGSSLGELRWGVGKLVCDSYILSGRVPVVLPFWHTGMTGVLGKGGRVPRTGNSVRVRVGEGVVLGDLAEKCRRDPECAWKEITERVREGLEKAQRGH